MRSISRGKKAPQFAEPQVNESSGMYPFCLDCPERCTSCPETPVYVNERACEENFEQTQHVSVFPDTTDTALELSGVQLTLDFDR